jgi:hypothetical protein
MVRALSSGPRHILPTIGKVDKASYVGLLMLIALISCPLVHCTNADPLTTCLQAGGTDLATQYKCFKPFISNCHPDKDVGGCPWDISRFFTCKGEADLIRKEYAKKGKASPMVSLLGLKACNGNSFASTVIPDEDDLQTANDLIDDFMVLFCSLVFIGFFIVILRIVRYLSSCDLFDGLLIFLLSVQCLRLY